MVSIIHNLQLHTRLVSILARQQSPAATRALLNRRLRQMIQGLESETQRSSRHPLSSLHGLEWGSDGFSRWDLGPDLECEYLRVHSTFSPS